MNENYQAMGLVVWGTPWTNAETGTKKITKEEIEEKWRKRWETLWKEKTDLNYSKGDEEM